MHQGRGRCSELLQPGDDPATAEASSLSGLGRTLRTFIFAREKRACHGNWTRPFILGCVAYVKTLWGAPGLEVSRLGQGSQEGPAQRVEPDSWWGLGMPVKGCG